MLVGLAILFNCAPTENDISFRCKLYQGFTGVAAYGRHGWIEIELRLEKS